MRYSLDQLETLVTVAESGSFSAASRQLGRAQSAVSTAIANLEIDLDVIIFDRSGHKPQLTAQGETIVQEARNALEACARLEKLAGRLAEGVESRITLAADDLIPEDVTADVLSHFGKHWPDVELEVLMGALDDIGEMVRSGRADLGYVVPLQALPVTAPARLVGSVRFIPVAAPYHPLAGKGDLTKDEVSRHRQIIVSSRSGQRVQDERVALRPWWCDGNPAIHSLVRNGTGWAFLPEHAVQEDLDDRRLMRLDFAFHPKPHTAPAYVMWTTARHLGPAARWLCDSLAQALTSRES
ncbi:LysR family transcriptional regulator [Desulfovibrio subterraneus]|jgi:DNA-binding transcriptional LysR family regulator|uniref:LysR family transcriptional regulator n=1 Tax=Desulfovibrio subterraneus TaxID=2718620 RepID=A0A7J0BHN2_9BACT|nr:LysR family transcriptional regulator [Desulfovibrio subterraneus]WBF66869.1 LysR family transcriptional regulator [Desulfovibrio subterraneus]GFM32594.1 LysR family transcriptional regulator [Desulfovibrio subterraneus]